MKEKRNKTAKRIAAGAAGVAAAAGMLVNAAVSDPATLLKTEETETFDPSHVQAVGEIEHRRYILETEKDAPLTLRERVCLRLQSMPLPVRALVLLPLWGIGEVLIALLTALWQSPVGQAVLHFLLESGLLVGLFALVWKLLFPHVPLRKIFSRKSLPWLIAGAAVITVADGLLGVWWDQWKIWRVVLLAVVGFVVLIVLWRRILDKLPSPKRKKQTVELIVE